MVRPYLREVYILLLNLLYRFFWGKALMAFGDCLFLSIFCCVWMMPKSDPWGRPPNPRTQGTAASPDPPPDEFVGGTEGALCIAGSQ
jgi:hypothetical protein